MAFPGIREEPLPLRRNAFRRTSFDTAQPRPCFNLASTSPSLRCGWYTREHRDQESVFARESRRARKGVGKILPVGTPFRRFQANDTLLTFLESL
jgi:hypothetical protein